MRTGPMVVGFDGSPESERALRQAAWLAEHDRAGGGLDLLVVFVRQTSWAVVAVDGGRGLAEATDEIEAAARDLAGEVLWGTPLSWRFEVRNGLPAKELVKAAAEEGAQTIVVGGHRHGALGSALVQSVNSELVHAFGGSLIIVRPPTGGCEDQLPAGGSDHHDQPLALDDRYGAEAGPVPSGA